MERVALALLERLLGASGGVAVAGLAGAIGCRREAVIEAVGQLRAAGCRIEDHPQRGLRLGETGLGVWADYLEGRHASGLGRRCVVYRETASTQQAARQLIDGEPGGAGHDGLVVLSDHQSAGRGRLGRRWAGRPGTQVLLTAVVDTRSATTDRLMLAACHAVCETVVGVSGLAPAVRWPNDVLVGGRKLSGILIETAEAAALIGVGLNVSVDPADLPPDLRTIATSLACEGRDVDRLAVIDRLLTELDEALQRRTDGQLLEAWRGRSCLLERRITVECEGRRLTGRVVDLDPRAGLMLAVERGPVVRLPAATTGLVDGSGI